MAHLTCRELLNLTHPGEYEAGVLKLPHVVAVRAAPAETGRFRNRLHTLQGRETTFYRASLEGRGSWTICDSGDQLELQVFISYAEMFWQTPQRTLHQAPLPVLVLPEQELQLRASDLRIWVAHFSYRRMFSEVAIAREGVVSPTLFLAQGRPSARLQCRRIMDEIGSWMRLLPGWSWGSPRTAWHCWSGP